MELNWQQPKDNCELSADQHNWHYTSGRVLDVPLTLARSHFHMLDNFLQDLCIFLYNWHILYISARQSLRAHVSKTQIYITHLGWKTSNAVLLFQKTEGSPCINFPSHCYITV